MTDMEIEKEIVAKGKTAARVTPERIQSVIRAEHYFTAFDGRSGALASGTYAGKEVPVAGDADLESLKLLTFCVLVLENGFIVPVNQLVQARKTLIRRSVVRLRARTQSLKSGHLKDIS